MNSSDRTNDQSRDSAKRSPRMGIGSPRVSWLIEWPATDGAVWLRPGGGFTIFSYEAQEFRTRKAAELRLAKLDWPGAFVSEHAWYPS